MGRVVCSFALFLCVLAAPVWAQNGPPPRPVTGTVASVDGANLTVTTDDGKSVALKFPATAAVVRNEKADFSAIKPGDFIASAAFQRQDGKLHAQELRIFPEAMRGLGEGHRPMAQPHETMTNATVAHIVSASKGGVLTTKYPGGTTDIVVDPATPITEIVSVDRGDVKPGAKISVRAVPDTSGALAARTVTVR